MKIPANYITSFSLAQPIQDALLRVKNVTNMHFYQSSNTVSFYYIVNGVAYYMTAFIRRHFKNSDHTLSIQGKVANIDNPEACVFARNQNSNKDFVFYNEGLELFSAATFKINLKTIQEDIEGALQEFSSNLPSQNFTPDFLVQGLENNSSYITFGH